MVLNDWQRGKIPYFIPPPLEEGENINTEDNASLKAHEIEEVNATENHLRSENKSDENKGSKKESRQNKAKLSRKNKKSRRYNHI